ncbi:YrhB domain-containing protein [Amnibacterium flavum]|uniref:Immunity protein 35 domain-containing protein n=1 Tax=Amnibacterium flavum TaxID=2173173 RepID=A0A2V1HY65_9MICO|nr:YrhB domain-containing protein [Amnibacterium flavum]PVZ95687.1 hypothetical protein DDQ50_04185 [Amnibacterium flavum]
MRSLDEARTHAAALLAQVVARNGVEVAFFAGQFGVPEHEDHGDVWVFNWQSVGYLRTGDARDQLLIGPIVVPKDDRPAVHLGTADTTEDEVERWRKRSEWDADPLIREWAERLGMSLPSSGPDVVRGFGDMEVDFELQRRAGRFVVVRVSRGVPQVQGSFATEQDGDRFLLIQLINVWRSEQRRPAMWRDELAAGVALDEGPTSVDLRWEAGEAEFPGGRLGVAGATQFSHAIGRSLEQISHALSR